MEEIAITIPLDVVERLLVMAMWATMQDDQHPSAEDHAAIKLVEREIEQVKRLAGN